MVQDSLFKGEIYLKFKYAKASPIKLSEIHFSDFWEKTLDAFIKFYIRKKGYKIKAGIAGQLTLRVFRHLKNKSVD